MKFARLLRTTAEDLPELNCLFHIYKHLKKQLKQLPARSDGKGTGPDGQTPPGVMLGDSAADAQAPMADGNRTAAEASEEARFTAVLTDHLQRLNDRFLEREETCVIQLERLEAEAAQYSLAAKAAIAETAADGGGHADEAGSGSAAALKAITEQRAQLYKRFVNFHGEVLLLVHWSVLAYTATVKILKKHHKRTGLLLRAPQLADLLSQPFCSSELMTGLARKAEACIQRLAEQLASTATSGGTTDGGGGGASGAGVGGGGGGGGGGPQDTVEQEYGGGGGAAEGTAAGALRTAAAAGFDDSYGVADGSSPSCSQSMGGLALRVEQEPGGDGAAGATAVSGPPQQLVTPECRKRRRWGRGDQLHEEQAAGGAGAGGPGAAGAAGVGPGGGASFLRNLTRLKDNSAASLSGPHVLEQLAELQQYVDKYDKMDDDLDLDDDLDDAEEDSAATTTANTVAAAAATTAAALAAATDAPAGSGALANRSHGTHSTHLNRISTNQTNHLDAEPSVVDHAAAAGVADGGGDNDAGGLRPSLAEGQSCMDLDDEQTGAAAAAARLSPCAGDVRAVRLTPTEAAVAEAALPPRQQSREGTATAGAEHDSTEGGAGSRTAQTYGHEAPPPLPAGIAQWPPPQGPPRPSPSPPPPPEQRLQQNYENAPCSPLQAVQEQQQLQQRPEQRVPLAGQSHGSETGACGAVAAAAPAAGAIPLAPLELGPQNTEPQREPSQLGAGAVTAPGGGTADVSGSGHGSGQGSAPAEPSQPRQPAGTGGACVGAPPQSSSSSAAATAGGGSVSVALSEMFGAPRPLSSEAGAANLLRRTQVALTMWEQLRTNASTPSTVIDPSAGQQQQPGALSQGGAGGGASGAAEGEGGGSAVQGIGGGGSPRSKRRRVDDSAEGAGVEVREDGSMCDDSGSNSE